jgi:uncharacterized membrane protein
MATDVTPDGKIVVGYATGGNGFVWKWKQDPSPTVITGAGIVGTSDDGTVFVGDTKNPVTNKLEASRWTQATGWVRLGGLAGATGCDANLTNAYAISGDGNVVVGLAWGGAGGPICQASGFRWTQATGMQQLQLLASAGNRCSAISRDGSTMGGFAQGNFSRTPAYWDANLTGFVVNANFLGEVFGFNNDGSKSVGTVNGGGGSTAYVRDRATGVITPLGTLNSGWVGNATDISEDGNFICGWDSLMLAGEAWLWTSTDGIVSLQNRLIAAGVPNVPALRAALACSDDGSVIVGGGAFSPGFIAELPMLVSYGAATPGCAGSPVLSATPAPFVNTPSFAFHSTLCPPSSLGLVLLTDVPDIMGSDPFGIGVQLHVDLFFSSTVITLDPVSDPFGNSTVVAGIANNPFLGGLTFYTQILWAWPTSTCFIPPYNLSMTQGLAITIQP